MSVFPPLCKACNLAAITAAVVLERDSQNRHLQPTLLACSEDEKTIQVQIFPIPIAALTGYVRYKELHACIKTEPQVFLIWKSILV